MEAVQGIVQGPQEERQAHGRQPKGQLQSTRLSSTRHW